MPRQVMGTISHDREGMMRLQEKEETPRNYPPVPKLVEMSGDPRKVQGTTMVPKEVLRGVEVGDHQEVVLDHQEEDLGHPEGVLVRQEDLDHHPEDLGHQEEDLVPLALDHLVDQEVLGHVVLPLVGILAGVHRCRHPV